MPIAKDSRQLDLIAYTPRDGSWRALNGAATSAPTMQHGGVAYLGAEQMPIGWQASVSAGIGAFGNTLSNGVAFPFYGRAIGAQVRRTDTYLAPVIPDFVVDGRVYPGADVRPRWLDGTAAGTSDHFGVLMIDTDLPDTPDGRPHVLEIIHNGDRDSSQPARTLLVYALIVDKVSGGYVDQPKRAGLTNHAAVPLTLSTLYVATAVDRRPRGVRQIRYTNPLAVAVPIIVTSQFSGSDVQFWKKALGADSSDAIDFPSPTVLASGYGSSPDNAPLKHYAVMPTVALAANISFTNTSGTFTITGGAAALGLAIGTAATIKIDSEIIAGSFTDANTFTPTARGQSGTTAATHSNGATVTLQTPGPYFSVIGES